MNFTANPAAATASTVVYSYSAQELARTAASGSAAESYTAAPHTAQSYTVIASGSGLTFELRIPSHRDTSRTRALAASAPEVVDPLSSRTSGTTLAAAAGSKRGKRAATSQWDG